MLHFITSNTFKFAEVQKILPQVVQLPIELPEIQEYDAKKIIEAKLQAAFVHHPGPFMVEDTSFHLSCLNGLPGPLGKWFEIRLGNPGIAAMVEKMGDNKSTVATLIGYAENKDTIMYFKGSISGIIVQPRGDSKFGFNEIFQPDGFGKTFGEMSMEEKNEISMRAIAVKKLKKYLETA